MRFFGNGSHADAAAVSYAHHFQHKVLAVFVSQGQQDLLAAFKFFGQALNLLFMGSQDIHLFRLSAWTIIAYLLMKKYIGKENRDH